MSALEQRNPAQELANDVRSDLFKQQIKVALPPNVTVDRFVRIAITALQANPDLATADRDSVIRSLIQCAQIGLFPDGKEAALVIYNTKVGDTWVKKAQLIPMIGGFRKIAAEHGWTIRTQVVYQNDHFEWEEGLNERLEHRPTRPGMERGSLVAAYAIGVHRDGRREFQVFTETDVAKAKAASKASAKGPWVDWTDRMWEKTAGRRLFSKLPLADEPRAVRMIEIDSLAPGDAARALYGAPERAALTESPRAGQPADVVDGDDPGPSGREAAADNTQGAAADPSAVGDGAAEATDHQPAAAPPIVEEEIDWPGDDEPAQTDGAAEALAVAAAAYNPGSQQWPGQTLGEIWAVGDTRSRSWFKHVLVNAKRPEFVQALRDFVGHHDPALLHEALAEGEVAS